MSQNTVGAYETLEQRFRRWSALRDAAGMLHWDMSAMMPEGGHSARADGPKDVLDRLQLDVVGGELRIGTKPGSWFGNWHWGSRQRTVIDVTLPFPRDLNAPEVTDLRAKLWDQVREESLKAMGGPP